MTSLDLFTYCIRVFFNKNVQIPPYNRWELCMQTKIFGDHDLGDQNCRPLISLHWCPDSSRLPLPMVIEGSPLGQTLAQGESLAYKTKVKGLGTILTLYEYTVPCGLPPSAPSSNGRLTGPRWELFLPPDAPAPMCTACVSFQSAFKVHMLLLKLWEYQCSQISTLSEPILRCLSISLIPRPQRAPAFHVSVVESNLRTPTNFTLFSALLSAGVAHRRHRYCGSAADSVGDHFCIKLCDCEMKSEYTRELARVYLFPGLSFTRMRRMP